MKNYDKVVGKQLQHTCPENFLPKKLSTGGGRFLSEKNFFRKELEKGWVTKSADTKYIIFPAHPPFTLWPVPKLNTLRITGQQIKLISLTPSNLGSCIHRQQRADN